MSICPGQNWMKDRSFSCGKWLRKSLMTRLMTPGLLYASLRKVVTGVPPPSSRRLSPVSLKYEYTSLESQHCICSPDGNRMRSSLSVSGSVTLRNVCAWNDFVGERTDRVGQLVDCDDDVVRGHAAGVRIGRVIVEPVHLGALEDLHAVVDQQVLEPLQALQRIDSVRAAVPDARGVALARRGSACS